MGLPAGKVMERRNSERIEVSWDVDCSTEDTFLFASIRDISELGVFVQTTEPLSIGSEVSLRFHTRDELGVFELRAVVRWIKPQSRDGTPIHRS